MKSSISLAIGPLPFGTATRRFRSPVSTTVVCTGDVDGYVWTGIVFFEDTEGTFVVVEV